MENKKEYCESKLKRYKELQLKMEVSDRGPGEKYTQQATGTNSDCVRGETLEEYKNLEKELREKCRTFLPPEIQDRLRL